MKPIERYNEELENLPIIELKNRWERQYNSAPPPRISRALLIRALAFERQATSVPSFTFNNLQKQVNRYLKQLDESGEIKPTSTAQPMKAGTRLLRTWKNKHYEVTVTSNGEYEWQGQAYKSLSKISREITGTRRNGPAFFGLRGN